MAMKTAGRILSLAAMLAAGGCSASLDSVGLIGGGGAAQGMSLRHIDAVTAAAREITGDPTAQVHGLKARPAAKGRAMDICGYVRTTVGKSIPIYVELREQVGLITSERGQWGQTPENLAKVKFMCREHGDW